MARTLVTFRVAGILFGVDVAVVREVLQDQAMEPAPRAPEAVLGIVNLRGRILGVTDVRARMALPPAAGGSWTSIVVEGSEGQDVLRVDTVGDVVSVPDGAELAIPETTPPAIARCVQGAYEVEGHLLLVVDLSDLLYTDQ